MADNAKSLKQNSIFSVFITCLGTSPAGASAGDGEGLNPVMPGASPSD